MAALAIHLTACGNSHGVTSFQQTPDAVCNPTRLFTSFAVYGTDGSCVYIQVFAFAPDAPLPRETSWGGALDRFEDIEVAGPSREPLWRVAEISWTHSSCSESHIPVATDTWATQASGHLLFTEPVFDGSDPAETRLEVEFDIEATFDGAARGGIPSCPDESCLVDLHIDHMFAEHTCAGP